MGTGNWSNSSYWINSPATGGYPQNGNAGVGIYDAIVSSGAPTLTESITIGSLTFSSGTIGGSAPLNVQGNLTWSGGGMTGAGTTTAAGNASTISGTEEKVLSRILENTGTMTYSAGSGVISLVGGTLNNSGTFNTTAGGDFGSIGASATAINNSGTWNVSGAGTTSSIGFGLPFHNTGTVNVHSGTIAFNGNYTQTAGALALVGGSISGSNPLLIQGGQVTGTGTISGSLNNSGGTIRPGLSAGVLSITSDLTLSNDSTLAMEVGGRTQGTEYDLIIEAGTLALNLDGLLTVNFINGFQDGILITDVFTIVNSNQAVIGAFDNVANGQRLATTDGLGSFLVNYGVGSAFGENKVVLSQFAAVPEASTIMLLPLAAGALLLKRRRR